MRKLLLAVACLAPIAGCADGIPGSPLWNQRYAERHAAEFAAQNAYLAEVAALSDSDKLECRLMYQQATAGWHGGFIQDIVADAQGREIADTCARMKVARASGN